MGTGWESDNIHGGRQVEEVGRVAYLAERDTGRGDGGFLLKLAGSCFLQGLVLIYEAPRKGPPALQRHWVNEAKRWSPQGWERA